MPIKLFSRSAAGSPARASLLALTLLAALPGCAASDPDRAAPEEYKAEAFRPLAEPFNKVGFRWDWSGFPSPAAGERVLFLEAWPDAVVTQDSASKVTVIEPSSGRARWAGEVAGRLNRFVGISRDHEGRRDHLIASSESEAFVMDIHTGNLISRQRFENVVNTPPLLLGQIGVYGTPTGELLAHQYVNGTRAWAYQAIGPVEQPPILAGHVVAGATQAGEVSMIDVYSGSLAARSRMYAGPAGPLATDGALIFIASLDQSLYAFAANGHKVWQHRTSQPLAYPPVCIGARVFCHTADLGLSCFDAATGRVIWSNKEVRGSVIGTRNGDLFVWDGSTFSVLEPERGATVSSAEFPTIRHIRFDRFDGGNLYVVNRAGVVGRFVPVR